MVDIHTHILPCFDDGAKSMDEAIQMLNDAQNNGTTDLICTPHFNCEEQDLQVFINKRQRAFDKLLMEANKQNQFSINLYQGAEVYFTPKVLDMIIKAQNTLTFDLIKSLCLNKSRYMLLELPFITPPIWVERYIYELQLRGVFPVIAHLERYSWVKGMKNEILKWVNQGAIIQVNAKSLMERDTSFPLRFIMDSGIIHVLGSDAHDSIHRNTSDLGKVLNGSEKSGINFENLRNNGFNILEDYGIIVEEPNIKKSGLKSIFRRGE